MTQHTLPAAAVADLTTPVESASTPNGAAGPPPKFARDDGFQAEVGRRVAAYFRASGTGERDCWQMYLKTAAILTWWAVSYGLLVFVVQTWWQALPAAVSLAVALAAIGFSIQHDGGHHAYSRRRWVNRLAATSIDLMGASSYLWHWKHHVIHHTYVNVPGQDTDIDPGPVLRLSPHQPRHRFHRWQHLYVWVLYAISAPRWHLYGDFKDYVTGRIGPHPVPRPQGWAHAVFWVGKLASIVLMLGIPLFFHPLWVVALFYLLVTGLMGVLMSVVFQLAHCVPQAAFPAPAPDTRRMPTSWAVHQVETTVDFAPRNRALSWLLGGLNFQIEHHLFPRVCHIHYPALSRIVEGACREFGVRYYTHPTLWAGLAAHYGWLRELGRHEPVPTDGAPSA